MKLELNDIRTLISWVTECRLSAFEYQDGDMKIRIGGTPECMGMPGGPGPMMPGGMPGQPGPMMPGGMPGQPGPMMPGGMPGQPGPMMPGGMPGQTGSMMPGGMPGQPGPMMPDGMPGQTGMMASGNTSSQPETTSPDQPQPSTSDAQLQVVESPLVGTFYAAPSEDGEPYVRVGDTVKCGQVVGIVEAMKLMNEIEAECDGVVEEILVNNDQMVEYGQPLMKIRK
jgi:acetyl-CoA carboxylase biotin carboxyl carrier protein